MLLQALVGTGLACTDIGGPVVREPVPPKVRDVDLQEESKKKPVKPWKPGEPIRVIPDLKEEPAPGPPQQAPDTEGQTR